MENIYILFTLHFIYSYFYYIKVSVVFYTTSLSLYFIRRKVKYVQLLRQFIIHKRSGGEKNDLSKFNFCPKSEPNFMALQLSLN